MLSHHDINEIEKIECLAPLIHAGRVSEWDARHFSTDEVNKLQALTLLILARKISEFSARSKSRDDIEKLQRLTPLILTGRVSAFGACHMSLMEIENKLFTYGCPGTFFGPSQHYRPSQQQHSSTYKSNHI